MFYGTFEHALDDKNRLMIPAKLREELPEGERSDFFLTVGLDECLWVYPKKGWEHVVARMQGVSSAMQSKAGRDFQRAFFSRVVRQELDAAGRLLVPEGLRGIARLRKDVALVGVMDRIELWDKARWKRLEQANAPRYERNAEEARIFGG